MAARTTTSWDVAAVAGVSQATVSRALRNSPLVRAETRERIQKIARELNYQVNRNAAGLRTRQSQTLALLLFDEAGYERFEINPFFLSMLGSITQSASRHGYDILVSFQQQSDDWHTQYIASNRADGIILLGYGDYVSYRKNLQALARANTHFLIWGPMHTEQDGHSIACDNLSGGELATRHLVQTGCRRIAFIGQASKGSPELEQRFKGYQRSLKESGLRFDKRLRVAASNNEDDAFNSVVQLIKTGVAFDAIFAATDTIAIGALRALKHMGLDVPGDISVVGFDDLPVARYISPALTTIRQNVSIAGELLVNHLVKLINGESVRSTLIPPELIVRESSRRI